MHRQTLLNAVLAWSFVIVDSRANSAWSTAAEIEPKASAAALEAIESAAMDFSRSLDSLRKEPFASVPLSKADAAAARRVLTNAHVARLARSRKKEFEAKRIIEGTLEMPYEFRIFGAEPADGHSLWISMHGGGSAPKHVNDQQWENQKRLYDLDEGIYVAPRAPTNTWNLWHEPHIDRMFSRLIENFITFKMINPNKVFILGYSAGGDGVYQLAPRMADQLAGAAMMAGHPNGVSLRSVRNLPFALQVGAKDAAHNRNAVAADYGTQLAAMQQADPGGYPHFVKIHEDKGHWMNLEDKVALAWLAKFDRNPLPEKVVWKQTGVVKDRFYWLAVPPSEARSDSTVVVERNGQAVTVTEIDHVPTLILRLDDRVFDLDAPITIRGVIGEEKIEPRRTLDVMLKTFLDRGDPELMFDAEVTIPVTSR
jgi:poly(3-hydroxybutyrate) depolymerase